jgi:hypothetical protein
MTSASLSRLNRRGATGSADADGSRSFRWPPGLDEHLQLVADNDRPTHDVGQQRDDERGLLSDDAAGTGSAVAEEQGALLAADRLGRPFCIFRVGQTISSIVLHGVDGLGTGGSAADPRRRPAGPC